MSAGSEHDLRQMLSACSEEAERFLDTAYQQFKQPFSHVVTEYTALIESLLHPEEECPENPEQRLCILWNRAEDMLGKLHQWTEFDTFTELKSTVDRECRARIQEKITELPQILDFEWQDDVLSATPADTWSIKAFKTSRKVNRFFARTSLNISNIFRTDKKTLRNERRTLYLRPFIQTNLLIPLCDIVSGFGDRILHTISGYLAQFHESTGNITLCVLGLDAGKNSETRDFDSTVRSVKTAVSASLPDMAVLEQTMDALFEETRQSLTQCISRLEKSCAHATRYSGTRIYPYRRYSDSVFKARVKQADKDSEQSLRLWQAHFSGEERDWSHEIALNKIQIRVARKTLEVLGSVREKIESLILPQCDHASETLSETRKRLMAIEQASEWVMKKNMAQEGRMLLQNFRKELIPGLARRVLGAGIGQEIAGIKSFAGELTQGLSESHSVFKKRDTRIPPRSELVEIPIRDLFEEEFLVHLQTSLDAFQQTLRIRLDDMINGMSDIRQVVEFNLESSFALLSKETDTSEAYQMAVQGIDRSIMQLESLMEQIHSLPDDIGQDLKNTAYKWMTEVQNILDNERLISLKLKLVKARATSKIHDASRLIGKGFRDRWTAVCRRLGKLWGQSQEKYLEFRSYLGLSLPDEDIQIQFTQFLQDTHDKLEELPYVYQQLFQIEPLTDSRLFQARTTELQQLRDMVSEHMKGKTGVFAVIGERGSGKTTLLNLIKPGIPSQCPFFNVELNTTIHSLVSLIELINPLRPDQSFGSLEDAESHLIELTEKPILIIENIQYLFVRTMDGFDLLDSFLGMVNRTRRNVTWIFSSTLYGWDYLDKIMGITGHFQKVISLKPFGREDIESMIMARHRMTGYKLTFNAPKRIRLSRGYKKLGSDNDRQAHLKKLFFEQIQHVASGNISVAILFWLRSIEMIREHELIMSSQVDFNVTFLSFLSNDDRFTLGAVIQHNVLGTEDHARIFRNPVQKSRLALQNLTNMGILQESEGVYKVHPFLYRHVVRSLKLQNIIH